MRTETLVSADRQAFIRLERKWHFYIKETTLDFSPEPLFPDWWQITLHSNYGMLFDPNLGCQTSEIMLGSSNPAVRFVGLINLHQTSVLHPDVLYPQRVIELPLPDFTELYKRLASNSNFYAYAIGRIFTLALAENSISKSQIDIETALLFSYISRDEQEVFYALKMNDRHRLAELEDVVLNRSPHRLHSYWWQIFFERHLYS